MTNIKWLQNLMRAGEQKHNSSEQGPNMFAVYYVNTDVGRRLAELELYILLSKIIPLFHLSTDVKELELVQRTVLTSEKPVRIKMTPRQQQ